MSTIKKDSSWLLFGLLLLLLFFLDKQASLMEAKIARFPVLGNQTSVAAHKQATQRKLPLVHERATNIGQTPAPITSNLDEAFIRPPLAEKEKPIQPQAPSEKKIEKPDYFKIISGKIERRVTGISNLGIFIDDSFFSLGDKITIFPIPEETQGFQYPILAEISPDMKTVGLKHKTRIYKFKIISRD